MAIHLSFINFIVPIETIRKKYPGGWEQCLKDHAPLLGGKCWHDEHLFHDGAMSPGDTNDIAARWMALGFEAEEVIDGRRHFKDFCVVETWLCAPALPCPWLETSSEGYAWLKGTEPGPVAGPEPTRRPGD